MIDARTIFAAGGKPEKVPKKADFWSGKRNCSGNEMWALRTTKNWNGLTKFSRESSEKKAKEYILLRLPQNFIEKVGFKSQVETAPNHIRNVLYFIH